MPGLFVIPYLKTLRESKEMDLVIKTIKTAVNAAEQTISGSGMGSIKKEEVIKVVGEWLKAADINVSPEIIDIIIEDAVYVMNSNK